MQTLDGSTPSSQARCKGIGSGLRRGLVSPPTIAVKNGSALIFEELDRKLSPFVGHQRQGHAHRFELTQRFEGKPSLVALAWLLSKGDFIVPIPGTKTPRLVRKWVTRISL
jgi:aryl-alcohol dehydrogenase-like predicted oxidoreductase